MTIQPQNQVFSVPSYEGTTSVPSETPRQITPEDLRQDRQLLSEEASRLALSHVNSEASTPLFFETLKETEERKWAEMCPEAKELQRISGSLHIMQDKYIDAFSSKRGLMDFSFSEFPTILSSILAGRTLSDSDREKVRLKLIEQETTKSAKVFENDPDVSVPDDQLWLLQHMDGHFFWFIYDKSSQATEPGTIVHFTPTPKGVEKTVKFADEEQNRHHAVGKGELEKLIQLFNSYENMATQDIYFKIAGWHQAQ